MEMLKYIAVILLLASLAFCQEGYVKIVDAAVGTTAVFPVGCVSLYGEKVFVELKDNVISIYSNCTDLNEDNLESADPCQAPQCEFITEIPSGFIKYQYGDSCDNLGDLILLIIENKCAHVEENIYIKLEEGSEDKHINATTYTMGACSGDPFQVIDLEFGKCQQMDTDTGESMFVKIEQSAGIQTIVSIILLMATVLIAFV